MIIPKKRVEKVSDAESDDKEMLGHLLLVSKAIANEQGLDDNYRLIINNGAKAGQSVFHIHVHFAWGAGV